MNILVIFNPVSGQKREKNKDRTIIKELLEAYHYQVTWIETKHEKSIMNYFCEESINADIILVSGGDGTINQVISAMISTNQLRPLIIYPNGSGNEFAANRKITKEGLSYSLRQCHEATQYDIGLLNQNQPFTYSLTFGNFTHLTYQTPQSWKNKLGYFAYWIYGMFSLYIFRLKKYSMKIYDQGNLLEGSYLFGGISNAYTLGDIIHMDQASIEFDDGWFEVFLVRTPETFKQLRKLIHSLITRTYDDPKLFEKFSAQSISVASATKHSWNIDGEFAGKFNKVEFTVLKRKISVF